MSKVLLNDGDLTVSMTAGVVQISVGKPHDFRSVDLTEAQMMKLAGLLWLTAQENFND